MKENDCQTCIHRRDFLKLAAAAGLFVLAGCNPGQEPAATTTDEPAATATNEPTATATAKPTLTPSITPSPSPTAVPTYSAEDFEWMAYCGIRCRTACPSRLYPRTCVGCKATSGKLEPFCETCGVRKCAMEKKVLTCAHCEEYSTCENEVWTKYPALRRRIDQIRKDLNIQS